MSDYLIIVGTVRNLRLVCQSQQNFVNNMLAVKKTTTTAMIILMKVMECSLIFLKCAVVELRCNKREACAAIELPNGKRI